MNYKNLNWLWICIPIFILDQVTKGLARQHFINQKVILSFLNLHLSFNKGAAFSFLHNAGGWQRWFFISITLIICSAIIIWLCKLPRKEKCLSFSLSLIFSGAIGNLWDRMVAGYVTDFIEFHLNHWYFPTFNVADSAITIGTILLLFQLLVLKK